MQTMPGYAQLFDFVEGQIYENSHKEVKNNVNISPTQSRRIIRRTCLGKTLPI